MHGTRSWKFFSKNYFWSLSTCPLSADICDAIICTHESKETNSKGEKSWYILRSKMLFINSTQQRRRHRREEKNLNAEMRGKRKAWEKWDEKKIPGQSCENDDDERKRRKWVSRRWKIYRFFLLLVSFTLVALLNTTNDDDCFMVVVCCRELEFYNIASISAFSRCRDNNDPLIKDKTCSMLSLFFPFTASTDDYIELTRGIKNRENASSSPTQMKDTSHTKTWWKLHQTQLNLE